MLRNSQLHTPHLMRSANEQPEHHSASSAECEGFARAAEEYRNCKAVFGALDSTATTVL